MGLVQRKSEPAVQELTSLKNNTFTLLQNLNILLLATHCVGSMSYTEDSFIVRLITFGNVEKIPKRNITCIDIFKIHSSRLLGITIQY